MSALRKLSILASATLPLLAASCRTTSNPKSRAKQNISDNPLAPYEVVDCTPKICGNDVAVVGMNASDEDLTALGMSGEDAALSLDDSSSVEDVSGKDADSALERAKIVNKTLNESVNGGKNSKVARTGLTGFFGSLSHIANQANQAATFARTSIDAPDEETRSKTMTKMLSLISKARSALGPVDIEKLEPAMEAIATLGGDDGWLNKGDLPRFLPVIPNVVGRVADQKISQGYAEGIADLSRTRPFAYKRWARRPNGIIGSIVQKNVDKELNAAYSQKYAAIRQTSDQFQTAYNQMMDQLGVKAYYLKSNDGKNYYDPGKAVEEEQIDKLLQALTGKSLDEIVRAAADNPQAVLPNADKIAVVQDLANDIELPDGLPLADITQTIKESDRFTKTVLPKGLMFKLLENGKIQITRASTKNQNTSDTPTEPFSDKESKPTPPQASALKCSGTTLADRAGNTMLYLYSSLPGSAIELQTPGQFFNMTWVMDPQTGWPLIRGGYAHFSWRQQTNATMRVTLGNGDTQICTGSLEHR